MSQAIKTFISYSHDSNEWIRAAIALAEYLAKDGIDVRLDRFDDSPPMGWPKWMDLQIREADHIIVVSSCDYHAKYTDSMPNSSGKGSRWESLLAVQRMYEAGGVQSSIIPVLFQGSDSHYIIDPLKPFTYYCVYDDFTNVKLNQDGYNDLYRKITNQPKHVRPPIGTLRRLPPESPATGNEAPDSSERSVDQDNEDIEEKLGGGISTATGRAEVTIVLNKPIDAMSIEEKDALKDRVARAIDVNPAVLTIVFRDDDSPGESR